MQLVRASFLCIILLGSWSAIQAQSPAYPFSLLPYTTFLIDSSDVLSINSVMTGNSRERFTDKNILSNRYPTWLEIKLPPEIPVGDYYIKERASEGVELYIPREGGIFFQQNGVGVQPAKRSVPMNYLFLKFSRLSGDTVIYMKVSPMRGSSRSMGMLLNQAESVEAELATYSKMSFFITGAILFILVSSFSLFLILNETNFLIFCLYILCSYLMSNAAFLQYLLGDSLPLLFANYYANQVYFILYPLALLLFSITFLQIRSKSVRWWKIFFGMMVLSVVCFVTMPFDRSPNSDFILLYNSLVILLIVIYSAYAFFWKKFRPALYFLLAFLVPVLVAILIVLNYLDLISIPTGLGLMAGSSFLVQSIILSFGLVVSYRQLTQDFLNVSVTKRQKEHEAEFFKSRNQELVTLNETIEKQKVLVEKQAQRLEEMNETKDKLLSVLSHDLRGPVGNLNSIMSMLSNKILKPEEFYELAEKLKLDVKGAHGLLEDVLLWVRSQQSGIVAHPVEFSIDTITREVVLLSSPGASLKGIEIQIEGQDQVVKADPNHVHIILRNLVGNAIKFGPDQSKIKIAMELVENEVMIKITDQGIGLSEDDTARILQGEKVSSTPGTRGEKGTGIGLLLCKEFIRLNRGRFFIFSDPGKGTTVAFSLPLN